MAGDASFWWYGLFFILIIGLVIVIPVWRRKADALTAWNFLLLGAIVHIGVGCLEVYDHDMHWKELKWFQWNNHEKNWFMVGTFVFYASLIFFHYKIKFPDRFIRNRLTKWPEPSGALTMFVMIICFVIAASASLVQHIPFVREIALNFSHCALATAVTFATVFWLKDRTSLVSLSLVGGTLLLAMVDAMVSFAGRRLLLTVLVAPIVALYWMSWRYWSRTKLIAVYSGLAALMFLATAAYASFRHMKASEQRNASTVIAKAKSVSADDIRSQLFDIYHYLAQYTVHYSMLTERLVDMHKMSVIPLDTLRVMIAYPIPRSLWPNKPKDECEFVSTDVLKMPYKTNWGVGVTGQGYHDGGLAVLVFYALLASIMVRFFDIPLASQPDNPFLLSALASGSAHLMAWSRGSLSAMSLNLVDTFAFIIALSLFCRAFFGVSRRYAGSSQWPSYQVPAPTNV